MKIHVGCGTVYLRDWVNVDLFSDSTFLAKDRPDLVEKYITTANDYYGRHKDKTRDKLRSGPLRQEIVCDAYGSFNKLPCGANEADEILARQVLEHLSVRELKEALNLSYEALTHGGTFIMSIPDFEATLEMYVRTGDNFYKRHLFGPRDSDWGYHVPYNREDMILMFNYAGFQFVSDEPNVHNYPAVTMRFKKA